MRHSLKTFSLTCTETCTTCHGTGTVSNPRWENYLDEEEELVDTQVRPEVIAVRMQAWLKERGYASTADMGARDLRCPSCDGVGRNVTTVDLREALNTLGVVRRAS